MTDLRSKIDRLRRPRLLIRAARFGLGDYQRDQVLRRLRLKGSDEGLPQTGVVETLLELEARCEAHRKARDPVYRVAQHVELMIALMAEASLLSALPKPDGCDAKPEPAATPRPIRLAATNAALEVKCVTPPPPAQMPINGPRAPLTRPTAGPAVS